MHIEIAGGGFAGLVAAAAFAQRGWSVRLHEAAPTLRSFGAGIYIAPNGQRVLRAIGAYERVLLRSYAAPYRESRDDLNRVLSVQENAVPGGGQLITTTRGDLHFAVAEAARQAGASIVTDSRVVAVEPEGVLVTDGGRRWPADLVLGADGVGSRVRDSLRELKIRSSQFSFVVHRFLIPRAWAGPRTGQWLNYVNYWNCNLKRRVLYTPCNEDDVYLLLGAYETDLEAHREPLSREVWSETFPVLAGAFRELPADSRLDHYEVTSLDTWSVGRVAIIGDAAHAMPPTIGQGAGTAMMNALSLAETATAGDDLQESLLRWEEAERPATEMAQKASVDIAQNLFSGIAQRGEAWDDLSVQVARWIPAGSSGSPLRPAGEGDG